MGAVCQAAKDQEAVDRERAGTEPDSGQRGRDRGRQQSLGQGQGQRQKGMERAVTFPPPHATRRWSERGREEDGGREEEVFMGLYSLYLKLVSIVDAGAPS